MEQQEFGALPVRRGAEGTDFVFRLYAGRFWAWVVAPLSLTLFVILALMLVDLGFEVAVLVIDLICFVAAVLSLIVLIRPKRETGRRIAAVRRDWLILGSEGGLP